MNTTSVLPILVIAGPTASGKSAIALQVAEAFGGTVINADSMQVYSELRILTARPTAADEARVPHRLYGILSAAEACSAGRWADMANVAIDETQASGRLAVLVGGTGLYLRALVEGLNDVPEIPEGVRREARDMQDRLGPEEFHAALAELDPAMAVRLNPSDRQRLIRAYEVFAATGRSLAEWQSSGKVASAPVRAFQTILMQPSREFLYAACNARVPRMIVAGAIDEVRKLKAMGLDPGLPAMKALGVAPLFDHLSDKLTLDEAVFATQKKTRNYAKRQVTWFRNQVVADITISPEGDTTQLSTNYMDEIFSFIRKTVLTAQ